MGSESTAFGSQVGKTRRQPALCVCLRVRGRSGSQRACSKKSAVIYSVHAVPTSFNHHNLNIIQTVKGTYFLLKPRCAKWKCQSFSIYQSMTTCWEEKKKGTPGSLHVRWGSCLSPQSNGTTILNFLLSTPEEKNDFHRSHASWKSPPLL